MTATVRRRLSLLETDMVLAKAEQETRGSNDAVAQIIQSAARERATDLEAVSEGYISVTPLHVDLTHHASIGALAESYAE